MDKIDITGLTAQGHRLEGGYWIIDHFQVVESGWGNFRAETQSEVEICVRFVCGL